MERIKIEKNVGYMTLQDSDIPAIGLSNVIEGVADSGAAAATSNPVSETTKADTKSATPTDAASDLEAIGVAAARVSADTKADDQKQPLFASSSPQDIKNLHSIITRKILCFS